MAGQKIAEMGNTDSNAVKLHFEIRRQGKSVDPARYLTPELVQLIFRRYMMVH